ncbi:MAG: hypothetical protein KJ725_12570 [Gammaproteobacteria bacterium]|jgi:hypothetical protein|uniref:hypothetical protein n=1 Tax=Methylotuvimicrobium sp. TaxID=2822413 RepID=UPI001DB918D0|nr:hypothetical protein [Gammaproteobacteria bacterium]
MAESDTQSPVPDLNDLRRIKPVMDGDGGEHSVFAASFIKTLDRNVSLLEGQEL